MSADLPERLKRRVEAIEKRTGRPVIVKAARWPDPSLRGRVSERAGAIVVEYRDETAGYFWDSDIISELLGYVERGHLQVSVRDRPRRKIDEPATPGPLQ